MDCRRALEILEVANVDSNETSEAAVGAARAHLESCRRCEKTLRGRQKLDLQIADVIRDVKVPSTLKQRLLEAVADEEAIANERLTDTTVDIDLLRNIDEVKKSSRPSARHGRRGWLAFSLTAACLCVAVGWLIVRTPAPSLTLADIQEMLPVDAASKLPNFDGNFAAKPPNRRWEELLTSSNAKGLRANANGKHLIAVYKFRFRSKRQSFVHGLLLVIPVDKVIDPPKDRFFAREAVVYLPDGSAAVAWVSDGLLYVCWLPDGGHDLPTLERVLEGAPA